MTLAHRRCEASSTVACGLLEVWLGDDRLERWLTVDDTHRVQTGVWPGVQEGSFHVSTCVSYLL